MKITENTPLVIGIGLIALVAIAWFIALFIYDQPSYPIHIVDRGASEPLVRVFNMSMCHDSIMYYNDQCTKYMMLYWDEVLQMDKQAEDSIELLWNEALHNLSAWVDQSVLSYEITYKTD